jgi:[protein-PII] uridylyltransferase
MPNPAPLESQPERIWRRKQVLDGIRERARRLFNTGAMGLQVASMLSEKLDRFVVSIIEETLQEFPDVDRKSLHQECAMVVVGGSGRGEVAPFSDVDVLFVFRPRITDLIDRFSKAVVPEFWDAGIQLGQRVYTVREAVAKAKEDPHLASSLVHVRCLWGDESLAEQLSGRFFRRVVRGRRQFIESCIAGREEERMQHGATVQQLEPDVKKSLGGLRDVHLLQWVAFAHYETTEIETLRKKTLLSHEDARALRKAVEFLTRVRIDLHLHAGKPHDTLSRDEQLRITEGWGVKASGSQRPVENFMQEYFQHSMAVAEISRRFVSRHRPSSLSAKVHRAFVTHRINEKFVLSPTELGVSSDDVSDVCSSLDDIMRIYHSAATYRVEISPQLAEAITRKASELEPGPTPLATKLFMELLSKTGRLSKTLRSMHDTNVLELIIPEWKHVRCLLQFNQYHHFTVDEHTLKCLEICEKFGDEDSQLGAAYQGIRHRELLHLALILHDSAKGYPEDHSVLGAKLARDVCERLHLSEYQTDIVSFLVLRHLVMADLAFRHDISDTRVLMEFSHQVGTREKLDMLFVLTASDVGGVGPGVWNHWKSELLCEFHERLAVILSGQHPRFRERERLRKVREHVFNSIVPLESHEEQEEFRRWIDQQLDEFTPNYMTMTPATRIASDLDIIRGLEPGDVHVEGEFNPESGFTTYRIITDAEHSSGCFHLLAGALTARHLEILGADITTTLDDFVVDVFHVIDDDYSDDVPDSRIHEIGETVRAVLKAEIAVEELFRRHKTLSRVPARETVMELPVRVTIDDDTSDRCTVISVFAHDQPGLLYTITRTLYQLGLSIELAKIATHFDQVADVFYVTDNDGRKIASESHQKAISTRLMNELAAFEESTHREFVS